ncbi:MAG: hypothetical protein HC875_10880 [Anaerolineales bacterium]|nr:hypothetical protein [Anaerolineales bacterium]
MHTRLPTSIRKVLPLVYLSISLNLVMVSAALGNQIPNNYNPNLPNPVQAKTQIDTFVLMKSSNPTQLTQVQNLVKLNGGQTIHTLPYQAIIAQVPSELMVQLKNLPEVIGIFTGPIELATMDTYGPAVRGFASAWNSLIMPQDIVSNEILAQAHPDDPQDALIAPDIPSAEALSSSGEVSITPGYYQTSEYMAGSVAVGIVLIESNGSVDPSTENWTSDEKQLVFNEIMAALNWWAKLEPRANLSFVYEDHFSNPLPSNYEPITRSMGDQQYWINDAMSALGYTGSSYFTRVRNYNNDLRDTYQTDWAFTVFVVDSSADSDNRFKDNYFAYAYLGGPFMVMTYGNNGYGPSNMDAVAAHEIGHIFHALDQYSGAVQSCTRRSGYLNVENLNSQYGNCPSNVHSIMRGQIYPYTIKAIDPYAAGQIGWRDSDKDNILDPLDIELTLYPDEVIKSDQQLTGSGLAEISPYPSPIRTSTTINTITQIKYRLNYGDWQQTTANDNAFDETSEAYSFTSPILSTGLHILEVAAFDSAGNVSKVATETILFPDPLDPGPNTDLYIPDNAITNQSVMINGIAYHCQGNSIVQVEYRVNGGPWQLAQAQDGTFNNDYEPFTLALDLTEPGTYVIETFATDTGGNNEINFANREIQVAEPQAARIFLPIVTSGM